MNKFNIDKIRADFPVLGTKMKGKPLAYFDNGATGLTPEPVIHAIESYYRTSSCNIHRGIYELSETTTEMFEAARQTVVDFLHAKGPNEVILTHGATEGANIIAFSWGDANIKPGDEILVTQMEHHANLVPWQQLARRRSAVLKYIPVNPENGMLRLDQLDELLTERTKLVAVSAMSNVTGVVNPVETIIEKAHAKGARVVVDAAQFAVHHDVNVQLMDTDFLFFSGHKLYGPTGVGVLYGKAEILEEMAPLYTGGDMIIEVKMTGPVFRESPYKFEAGTPNIAGVLGLKTAIEYIQSIGFPAIIKAESQLMRYALKRAEENQAIHVYGPQDIELQGAVFSFQLADIHPHDVGTVLNEHGIAVRAGFHCAQPYVESMRSGGTVRASMAFYNTTEEIDRLFTAIDEAQELFSSM